MKAKENTYNPATNEHKYYLLFVIQPGNEYTYMRNFIFTRPTNRYILAKFLKQRSLLPKGGHFYFCSN